MKTVLLTVATILFLFSILEASALQNKKHVPLNAKPFLTDVLKPTQKTLNHQNEKSKAPILVKTTTKNQNKDHQTADHEVITGNTEFTHYTDAAGNTDFKFLATLASEDNDLANNASMLFEFDRTNGVVSLNISAIGALGFDENGDGTAEGCQGFWKARTNQIAADPTHPFQDNCYIYNPSSSSGINFSSFNNVQSVIAQSAADFTWVCNHQGQFYIFSVASCAWVPTPTNPTTDITTAIFFIEKYHSH